MAWGDTDQTWRDRLVAAIERDGRSQRAVSIAAGLGPGYINALLREGREPTVGSAIRVCRELGISLPWLIYGIEMSPQTEEILRLLDDHPAERAGILQILRARR